MHLALRTDVQKSRPLTTQEVERTNSISVSQPELQHSLGSGPRQNCAALGRLLPEPGGQRVALLPRRGRPGPQVMASSTQG